LLSFSFEKDNHINIKKVNVFGLAGKVVYKKGKRYFRAPCMNFSIEGDFPSLYISK